MEMETRWVVWFGRIERGDLMGCLALVDDPPGRIRPSLRSGQAAIAKNKNPRNLDFIVIGK